MRRNPVFDYDEALRKVDQDLETFLMLVELFVEQGPKDLASIKVAVDLKNPDAVTQSAHRLKGAVLQFCAPSTFEAAKKLEDLGKTGNLTGVSEACAKLELELGLLVDELRRTLEKGLAA
jgi:HPt (histidine-containing phosphotransfer) domain-containing protein